MVAAGADTMGHVVNGKQIEGTGVPGDCDTFPLPQDPASLCVLERKASLSMTLPLGIFIP